MIDYKDCQTYLDYAFAEHRRIHKLLQQARSAIQQTSGPDRDTTFAHVVQILRNVRNELARHFAEEDQGGCMEEAVSRCPRLGADVQRIEAEHPALLADIDRLIAQAEDGPETLANRVAIERGFDELCTELHAHEAAENAVLRAGFGTANGYDSPSPAPKEF